MRRLLGSVTTWSRSQQVVRSIVVLGPVLALLVAGAAGETPPVWLVALTAVVAALAALAPATGVATVALLLVAVWWVGVDVTAHPAALVAAAMLTAVHVAALLAELGPPEAPLDAPLVRRWVVRGAVVLGVAPALWVMARLLDGGAAPAGLWPAGLAMVLVAVVAVAAAFPSSDVEP